MFFKLSPLMIFAGLLLLSSSLYLNAVQKIKADDFRKGISSHQEWIDRFKETYDYRIFKMLANRGGAICDTEKAKAVSQFLKNNPDKVDQLLLQWRIILDLQKMEEGAEKDWTTKYERDAYVVKTPHYFVMGNKQHKTTVDQLAFFMEKIFKFYAKKFATDEEVEGRFFVRLFPNKSDYLAYKPDTNDFFAYYNSANRELVGYVPELGQQFSNMKSLRDTLIHVFFHEGFHQYLAYYVPDPPLWLNEGFAELFRAIVIRSKSLKELKLIDKGNLRFMKSAIKSGRHTPLKEFIYMDRNTFHADAQLHYAQAWSLVHFFAFGSKRYNVYYLNIMTHLKNGMDSQDALDATFAKVNYDKMELAWKNYIKKLR